MGALVWKGAKGVYRARGGEGHNGHCLTMHPGTPTCSWDEGVGARQQPGPHTDDLTTWDVWENSGVRSGEQKQRESHTVCVGGVIPQCP